MKIISLALENILKIRAIRIVPKSQVIEIKGENAAGKSSVLDGIVMGLKGKKSAPPLPVRRGSKKGSITINMDGDPDLNIPPFTIKSKVTDTFIETTIEPSELLHGETPRSFLDKLLGAISFDPLAFINQEEKKQRKVLAELVGVDLDAWDAKEKVIFDERTAKGRELTAAKARVDKLKFHEGIEATEEVSFTFNLNNL